MKQPLLLLTCLIAMTSAEAVSPRLDLQSLGTLHRHRIEQNCNSLNIAGQHPRKISNTPSVQWAFVTLEDGFSSQDLENEDIRVVSSRGNMAIVEVNLNDAKAVASLPCVKAMSLQRPLKANLDKAREEQHIDDILFNTEAAGLSVPYTGKGVITGIVDQGFDAHHINFRYANGESRISYLTWLRVNSSGTGIDEDQFNYQNLDNFTTDADYAYHGTHTLGIMSGSYNGPVTLAKPWSNPNIPETPEFFTKDNPYYGVAPEADIAVSCGDLNDAVIAYGMESLWNYKDFTGMPMVLNISLGSSAGAHDPNSAMSQFLDMMGEEAIICVAAGNEGDLKIALNKTMTEEDNTVKSFIYPHAMRYNPADPESCTLRYGTVEVWSDDETPFEIKAVIYNTKRDYRAAYNMPVIGEDTGTYYCSSAEYQGDSSDIVGDPTFCKAYSGYIGVGKKFDEKTGRYYGMIDYFVYNNPDTNLEDDYLLGFEVTALPGKRVDCYCDGQFTWIDNYGVDGFDDGSMNGSISDMAVAHNIIVVGSYNTRNNWTCLDGSTGAYAGEEFIPGKVSSFSSFGTLADGRNLPTICAPGSALISSVSWPYAKQLMEDEIVTACSAKVVEEGRVNYWKQEIGTSMATPFVSGSIALWLEANPDLTIDDVKDIIAKTAIVDDDVENGDPVRWGAGKFNALEGLKEAIRMASVRGIQSDKINNDRMIVTSEGYNIYKVFMGATDSIQLEVYSVDGKLISKTSSRGDEMIVDLNGITPGVYIIKANGHHSTKVTVK